MNKGVSEASGDVIGFIGLKVGFKTLHFQYFEKSNSGYG
jgi:hypothetical protein